MFGFSTEVHDLPATFVAAQLDVSAVIRNDGRIFVNGQNWSGACLEPALPAGLVFQEVGVSVYGGGAALRSDGQVVVWGMPSSATVAWQFQPAPLLPPGMTYTQVAVGATHLMALRSDGVIVAWGNNNYGQLNIPPLPYGVSVTRIRCGGLSSYALLSNGDIVGWGGNASGQAQVPPLPLGVVYTDVQGGNDHCVALRSDGSAVAWGSNQFGKTNVPPLPVGLSYLQVTAGYYHSCAYRSDGVLVHWGSGGLGQSSVPQLPGGVACLQLASGFSQTLALLSNGRVEAWGQNSFWRSWIPSAPGPIASNRYVDVSQGRDHTIALTSFGQIQAWGSNLAGQCDVPPFLQGANVKKVVACSYHSAALRADGQLFCWGDNSVGQCSVPPLPAGLVYTDVALSDGYTIALRSDGSAVHFGWTSGGLANIPPLPPGVSYVQVAPSNSNYRLLRSDGVVVWVGAGAPTQLPTPPPGLSYVSIAADAGGLLSDGTVQLWGFVPPPSPLWLYPPPLPWGMSYVEMCAGSQFFMLRRSDGQVRGCGNTGYRTNLVPPLEAGTSYAQVSAWHDSTVGRVGPTTTYVGVAHGCAGSMPTATLIPRDTPKIGKNLSVNVRNLPANLAVMAMGLQQIAPVDLGILGMPNCNWHVALDATAILIGQNNQARWMLPIPDLGSLVGLRFYNQAFVLDPAAGNGFGAVVSDAHEGVIGYP